MSHKAFLRFHGSTASAPPETAASPQAIPSFPSIACATTPPSLREGSEKLGFPLRFFELEREPFADLPDKDFFFSNAAIRQTYRELITALCERPGFALLTGESGAGKTILLRRLCSELKASGHLVIAQYRAGLDFDELIWAIAEEMNLPLGSEGMAEWLRRLRDAMERSGEALAPVLVIDDAERLGGNVVVNLVHLLAGPAERSLRILLSGRPQLVARLDLPVFAELKRMLSAGCRLERIEDDDVAGYIFHRLRRSGDRGGRLFSPAALNAVIAQSSGLPRRINRLCRRSLMIAATVGERVVTAEIVEKAAMEALPNDTAPREVKRDPAAIRCQRAAIAASLCATLAGGGMALHAVQGGDEAPDVVEMASAVAGTSASRGGAAIAHQPAELVSTGDAALPEDRLSSAPRPAQAALRLKQGVQSTSGVPGAATDETPQPRRLEPQPASSPPASLDLATPISAPPADPCRETTLGGAKAKCASTPAGADLGDAEEGGKADGVISPATEDLAEGDADVVSALMSRAQIQLEEGHIIAPAGDNAVESYRQIVASGPDTPEARRFLQQVRLALQASARNALAAGNGDEAQRLYALAVHPESDVEDAETTTQSTTLDPDGKSAAQPLIADVSGDTSAAAAASVGGSQATPDQMTADPTPAREGMTVQAPPDQAAGAPATGDATAQEMSTAQDAARSEPGERRGGAEAAGGVMGGAAPPETSERVSAGAATGTLGRAQAADPGGMLSGVSRVGADDAATTAVLSSSASSGHERTAAAAGLPSNAAPKGLGEVAAPVAVAQQASAEDAAKSGGPPPEARFGGSLVPAAVPTAAPISQMAPELIVALIKRGDELVRIGDISGARLAYERAGSGGSAKAMSALGMTYDPSFLGRVNARGMQPDSAIAAEWYRKAAALGDAGASRRLQQLLALAR